MCRTEIRDDFLHRELQVGSGGDGERAGPGEDRSQCQHQGSTEAELCFPDHGPAV
jgi:hypothetical protein